MPSVQDGVGSGRRIPVRLSKITPLSLVPARFDDFFMASQSGLEYLGYASHTHGAHLSQADAANRIPNYRNEGDADGKTF
jgi:hypothetical protein